MLFRSPSAFAPDVTAEARTPQGKHTIKVEKRLESTPNVDVYRFQMEEAVAPAAR